MTEFIVKEVKCESIGGFMVISSPFMEDEEDLLGWTQDLTYPTSAFSVVDPVNDSGSSASQDSLPMSEIPANSQGTRGRKRQLWENDTTQTKKQATKREPTNSPAEASGKTSFEGAEPNIPLWQAEAMETVPGGFENSLSSLGAAAYINELSSTVFKQETNPGQTQNSEQDGCTLQRLLQTSSFPSRSDEDCRFQYVLAAATSIASKQGEETLTYLNQGQSYGIKLKKVGELLAFKGKLLKSVIRLQFHERRLQYSEKEQILAWQASRPGERIMELDVPLSYGLFDLQYDNVMVNTLSFCWDPTQEVGAYIKVNSISTEFTPKKHGGEKGVPFRIQVETFIEGESSRLHAAACQIRVFKLKGADRKHKQEREKWLKLPESERAKYQPPYESTILSDLNADAVAPPQPFVAKDHGDFKTFPAPRQAPTANAAPTAARGSRANAHLPALPDPNDFGIKLEEASQLAAAPALAVAAAPETSAQQGPQFSADMTREQVVVWMLRNGFEMLTTTFNHFTGTDMLRLTRQDLVNLCGLPHGTRLYYAIHDKPAIRLTVYVSLPGKQWFNAICLNKASVSDLISKLTALLTGANYTPASIAEANLYLIGPNDIQILATDELLGNLSNESSFSLQIVKDDSMDKCCLLLRPTPAQP